MLRTLLIDDEPSSLNVLSILLKKTSREDIEIIGSTNCPKEGRRLIENLQPDVVFTDIEMPELSGIDIIRSFSNPKFRVVFVTAYDAYAIEAFRLSAIDYLLKPVGAEDVIRTVEKLKQDVKRNEANPMSHQLMQLERILKQQSNSNDQKIGIAMTDKIIFISVSEILYCEAKGAYTNVYLQDGRKIVASKSLGDFELQLQHQNFFRIHHSSLINLNHVKEFQRIDGGYVMMDNNKKLEVSQRKRREFLLAIDDLVV